MRIALALAVAAALVGCSKKSDSEKKGGRSKLGSQDIVRVEGASVVVSISVDWEGAYLSSEGLKSMQSFRAQWKDVPLTHFICPAYFTRGGDNAALAAQIREHVIAGDEVGLHLHSWFSLAEAAGVTPRQGPTFYETQSELVSLEDGDKGYEVALSAYSADEIAKLVKTSLALLEEHDLGRANSFRAGGYIGEPKVLAAVRANDITVDSSATWPEWFRPSRRNTTDEEEDASVLSYSALQKAWPNIHEHTQPYGFDTESGALIEVPNTGSFPEYASSDEMRGHMQRAMLASKKLGGPIYVNFGFHQESADEYVGALSDMLFNFRESYPGVLSFATVSAVAKQATEN